MPPRYSYWTILAGGLPTAFRAAEREDLLPTFKRIHEKHPDAEMKWFARGRLWASPEAARQDTEARRYHGVRDHKWRPGGEHRDPRQPYKDAKKARNADRRQQRFDRKEQGAAGVERKPQRPAPGKPAGFRAERQWRDRPPREKPHVDPPAKRASAPPGKPAVPPPAPPERGRPRPPNSSYRGGAPRGRGPHGNGGRRDRRRS